jgi:glycosyltransferase involved in cell wall biosynthesis
MNTTIELNQATKSQLQTITSISVIIPAYNDETTIGRLVTDVDTLLKNVCNDYEIICVNDGSKDNTLKVLTDLKSTLPKLKVVDHPQNKGFGFTIKELYEIGSKDLIFSLPGDYQYAPKELIPMAKGLQIADLIIGRRVKRNDPPKRRLQSHVYNFMLRTIYGSKYTDVNSIKLFRRAIMETIKLRSTTPFVDAELCIRADKAGFRVVEIPIEHLPRLSQGASGGKFSVIWDTFSDLVKMRRYI